MAGQSKRQHLYLKLAEAHAVMGYYFDHQKEIDQEIKEEWEQVQESTSQSVRSPIQAKNPHHSLDQP